MGVCEGVNGAFLSGCLCPGILIPCRYSCALSSDHICVILILMGGLWTLLDLHSEGLFLRG